MSCLILGCHGRYTNRHQRELLFALESSCPRIEFVACLGSGFQQLAGAPGPLEGKRERERELGKGWKTEGAELRSKSVHPWIQVAALRVPILNSALRVAV